MHTKVPYVANEQRALGESVVECLHGTWAPTAGGCQPPEFLLPPQLVTGDEHYFKEQVEAYLAKELTLRGKLAVLLLLLQESIRPWGNLFTWKQGKELRKALERVCMSLSLSNFSISLFIFLSR